MEPQTILLSNFESISIKTCFVLSAWIYSSLCHADEKSTNVHSLLKQCAWVSLIVNNFHAEIIPLNVDKINNERKNAK